MLSDKLAANSAGWHFLYASWGYGQLSQDSFKNYKSFKSPEQLVEYIITLLNHNNQ